ncbi:MAG: tRNA pseudouridine(55) synthase TruB, partial [Miltoncostaeaceae bacterium]
VKVGHTGTLDPFASGLLVVLVGRATRLARFMSGADKTYEADVRLGVVSDTGDPDGGLTPTGAPLPDVDAVERAVASFRGAQRQRVPALAAVKVDGERLYRRTRRGETPELPEREVTIHEISLRSGPAEDGTVPLRVRCSAGTYIRRLATDLGEALGCGAYCAALRRTAVGGLPLEGAVAPEEVRREDPGDLRAALAHLPSTSLTPAQFEDARHGRPIEGGPEGTTSLWFDDRLVAIAEGRADGTLHPKVVLT